MFELYIRWIQWNGRTMATHPVGWLVGVLVYWAALAAGYTWLKSVGDENTLERS